VSPSRFGEIVRGLYKAFDRAKEFDDIGKKIAMKTSGLTEVVDVVNNVYDEEVLKRSLPYVTKLNIETNDQPVGSTVSSVMVEYRNGLSMVAECTRTPIDTQELVHIAVAGSQQVLSTYVHRAAFYFASRERTVKRHVKARTTVKAPDLINVADINLFHDSRAECDFGRFANAIPSGAPSLREVLLTIQGAAIEKDQDCRSSSQVNSLLRDAVVIRPPEPPAPPTISKEQATRATKAFSDLLKSISPPDGNTPDHPDEG